MDKSASDAREGETFLNCDKKHLFINSSQCYIRHFTGMSRSSAWQ